MSRWFSGEVQDMSDFSHCKKVFYGELEFRVHPDVYEPSDDSFALARNVPGFAKGDVLDVGTGCGILAMVAGGEETEVLGVDVSEVAVENARFNAKMNGVECRFLQSNLFGEVDGRYDLIIFNPPYLPTAPGERL